MTATRAPETKLASSEASITDTGASSAGWPGGPSEVFPPNDSTFSASMVDGISGVHTGPGATLF